MKKFKVGDYVKIPKTKSIEGTIVDSNVVAEAIARNQDYLVVTMVNEDYYVADLKLTNSGDYFLEQDLEFYSTGHLGMITVSKHNLGKIHAVACGSWQAKIIEYANRSPFKSDVELTTSEVDVMFTAATKEQLPVLEEIFGKRPDEIDLTDKRITSTVDGIKIFGNPDDDTWHALIGLPIFSTYKNRFHLNPNYNWEVDGKYLIVTRK